MTGTTKAPFIMHTTFVFIGITVRKQMHVARSFSATSSAPPVTPVIKTCADYVRERCAALTKLLTFAMAARKPSTTAPLPINTVTMPFMQTANTESASHHPEPA